MYILVLPTLRQATTMSNTPRATITRQRSILPFEPASVKSFTTSNGTGTYDHLVSKPVLYQLSYRTAAAGQVQAKREFRPCSYMYSSDYTIVTTISGVTDTKLLFLPIVFTTGFSLTTTIAVHSVN